ncbi:hypothetical protein NDU88_004986 [Pleurodeles waltl]|uniref:Uncharacterized protein n=1 Tax=Pleurodeles waltl TaxID=8319 RepID=A0AAV7TT23_PLEWA|nr:hypothetical protein NDU88_004986 [Pleurodeles waltl]
MKNWDVRPLAGRTRHRRLDALGLSKPTARVATVLLQQGNTARSEIMTRAKSKYQIHTLPRHKIELRGRKALICHREQ